MNSFNEWNCTTAIPGQLCLFKSESFGHPLNMALTMNEVRQPLYLRLAGLLERMIADRSLRPGDRVPSVRQFSRLQQVSVPTALQAYATLETRGLIEARPKSGFYVRSRLADSVPEPGTSTGVPRVTKLEEADPVEALLADHADAGLVPFGAALPSARLLPGARLTRIMGTIGRRLGDDSIGYDLAPGHESLRTQLARRSLEWGCALKPEEFMVTVGATEAVSLALRATCKPGDTVAVETPTYFGLANTLRELQLKALPVGVRSTDGMDLDALERALRRTRVAACVTVPNFQNPTGTVMPEENKKRLIALCAAHSIALIEDDTYGDLPHEGVRPRCLKAFDTAETVILCGSFSKKLAPGYRVGYVVAGRWHKRVRALKQTSTLIGALLPTLAVAEFLKTGGFDRYLRSIRESYRQQVVRMREAIVESFPEGVALSRPQGGYLLWCQLPGDVDAIQLYQRARESGISIAPGPMFSPTAELHDFIRINCGYPWSTRVEQAVGVLGDLVRRMAK